jgi:hypothetical protein
MSKRGTEDAPGCHQIKVVTPDQQRAAAGYLAERYKISQRRAGRVIDRSRSTLRCDREDPAEKLSSCEVEHDDNR